MARHTKAHAMPADFPRVEVSSQADVDRVFAEIQRHALRILRDELRRRDRGAEKDDEDLQECEEIIASWIKTARRRIEPNLSVNGMSTAEGSGGVEAFDQALSQRVQHLAERADNLTAEAIKARKTLPARRAHLLSQRHQALKRLDERREARRREIEEQLRMAYEKQAHKEDIPTLARPHEVQMALRKAVEDIDDRSMTVLEQTSAAHEQANFVKRLRIMSASYQ